MPDARARARGVMLGLAVGDALGRPGEGMTREEIQERFGALNTFCDSFTEEQALVLAARVKRKDFDRALRFWKKAGTYSDSTQQAVILAYLLGRTGDISGHDVAEEYLRVAGIPIVGPYFGAFRGTADGFKTTVLSYRKQHDWRQCGVASAGNGAAARIAPVGFFYRADLDTMFWRAVEVSLVTHRDTRALAAAYAMAWLVASLAAATTWPGLDILDAAVKATHEAEDRIVKEYGEDLLVGPERAHDFSWVLSQAGDTLRQKKEGVMGLVHHLARERTSELVSSPTDGVVLASVVTSILVALSQGGVSFENAVSRVVTLGGDADTVGALVGALCGVFHGVDAIPERWREGVANSEGLLRYGDALTQPMQGDLPDPLEMESRLCAEEEAARQALLAKVIKA